MKLHHNCLYKSDDNMPPKEVLKQELSHMSKRTGLKISKLERSFWSEGTGDIYTSSPLPFKP